MASTDEIIEARYFLDPETRRPVRVAVYHDDSDAGPNPREDYDHFARLVTFERRFDSPDSDTRVGELERAIHHWRGGRGVQAGRVARYARMFASQEILFVGALDRNPDGSLSLHVGAEIDPDVTYAGLAVVTRTGWATAMGPDYRGDVTPENLAQQELDEYNAWGAGEVYRYVVTQARDNSADIDHGQDTDACWGMVGEVRYAMNEGVMAVLGEHTTGGGEPFQDGHELSDVEFDAAMAAWSAAHGHVPTGVGWPA